MKDLPQAVLDRLAARGGRPVVLVTATLRSTSGVNTTLRWASQGDGSGSAGYQVGGAGDLFTADIVEIGRIVRSLPVFGGVAVQSGGDVIVVNPDTAGDLWSDSLLEVDGGTCTIEVIFADGSETDSDRILVAEGRIGESRVDASGVSLKWLDGLPVAPCDLPRGRSMTPTQYEFAPPENWGRVRPVVLGDLRGRGFDISTPGDGLFPHVPLPTTNAQRQRADLFDETSGGERETLLQLYDQLVEIPDAAVDFGDEYLQVDDNSFYLWLRPHRIDSLTSSGVVNPEHASTPDLARMAQIGGATFMFVDLPGASSSLGLIGASGTLTASDVSIYTVYSKVNSPDTNPGTVTIRLNGTGLSGHTSIALNGAGTSVDTQNVGDHITDWSDIQNLSVVINGVAGLSGVFVHRFLARVTFRCAEVRAAFEQQRLYRSMQGFTENAANPIIDYQDAGYLRGVRMSDPVSAPADIAEAVLRSRDWGLGLTASGVDYTSVVLTSGLYPDTLSCTVNTVDPISTGDLLFIDNEVVRIEAITSLTLDLDRAVAGSRLACHHSGASVFLIPSGGEVDSASFRGAASMLMDVDASELVTNGELEGIYSSGVAPNWTEYDPSLTGTPSSCGGYTGRYGQQVERTSGAGFHPGIYQTISGLEVGGWYRAELYARSTAGESSVQISIVQTDSMHPNFSVDEDWGTVTYDFIATDTSVTMRLRNSGESGDIVQFDGASLRQLSSWRFDFAITEAVDSSEWFDRTFLPQSGIRLHHGSDGRIGASVPWLGREPVLTFDNSRILVESASNGQFGKPMISCVRSSADNVATGVSLRYGWSHLTKSFEGYSTLSAERALSGQTVSAVATGSPLYTLTVSDSSALAPKDSADEVANITSSGYTVTLPSGDLENAGVVAGDWLIVCVSYGTFLHQIAEVVSATQVTVVDRPPQFADAGQWSAGSNLYAAGSEIFGVCETPTSTTATVFRGLDDLNLTTSGGMVVGDVIWSINSASDDGTGARDQGSVLRDNRERTAMHRMVRHQTVRTIGFDAPYIRDRETATFLRNHLFDMRDRAWLIALITDLSTLMLDMGDQVEVEHDVVPGGSLSGEIVRQSLDLLNGQIDYVVRCSD
jgi:hypothetical protein